MDTTMLKSIGVVLILLLLASCAGTSAIEAPGTASDELTMAVPAASVETQGESSVVEPSQTDAIATLMVPARYMRTKAVLPYGDRLVVTNQSGYTLNSVDIFSDAMYLTSTKQDNLLGPHRLGDRESRDIFLADHPGLQDALETKEDTNFTVNAFDTDGDLYYRTWDPVNDSWEIILTLEELEYSYVQSSPPSQGDYVVVTNKTGFPLNKLFLTDPTTIIVGSEPTNILGQMVLLSGSSVRIQVDDLPWIAGQLPFDVYGRVNVFAVDTDGDSYEKTWYPTSDLWRIELTQEDLAWSGPGSPKDIGGMRLHLTNNSGFDIWYLYISVGEILDVENIGEDLLGNEVLHDGDSMWVDLSGMEHLSGSSGDPVYVVAEDLEGDWHIMAWDPDVEPWQITFTSENLLGRPMGEAPYEGATLSLYNATGEDIWFLYMMTESMREDGDEGIDVLGDDIWYTQDSFRLVPESFRWVAEQFVQDPLATLYIRGYTDDEGIFERTWAAADGWSIELRETDRLDL